jgi:hypothetical protein
MEEKKYYIGEESFETNMEKIKKAMQVYRNFETDEVTSSPPLNKVFTIENYRTDLDYKSGRENRRQRRKEQRKKK